MKFKEKVSFFLGAGASKAFGYPTTVEYLDVAKKKFRDDELWQAAMEIIPTIRKGEIVDIEVILQELEDFENYFNEILKKNSFKKHYLFGDNLFTLVSKGKTANPVPVKSVYSNNLYMAKNLREQIYRNIYDTYWDKPKEGEDYSYTYKELVSNFQNNNIDIFTTNYDLCLENTFRRDQILKPLFTDGFGDQFGDTIFLNNYSDSKFKYRLYKLHGSINWKRDPENQDDENNPIIHRINLRDLSQNLSYHPLLYPGTGTKNIQEYPFNKIYNQFSEQLVKSNYCIIIGFSFRDEAINSIFKQALEDNDGLTYIIWNPKRPDINFNSVRVKIFPEKFDHSNIGKFMDFLIQYDNSIEQAVDQGALE